MLFILAGYAFAGSHGRYRQWTSVSSEHRYTVAVVSEAPGFRNRPWFFWKCNWYVRLRMDSTNHLMSFPASICYPILFNHLQPVIGFKYSLWIIALIMLVTLTIAMILLRMKFWPEKPRPLFDFKPWTEKPFTLWAAYLFTSLSALYLPSFYIQLYGLTIMDQNLAFYLSPALNSGSFFGRLVSPVNALIRK